MKASALIQKVKDLTLPTGQYVVFGSGPMAAQGLREAGDIELFVTSNLYEQLKSRGGWQEKTWDDGSRYLIKGDFEVYDTWDYGDYHPSPEELIAETEIIEGVPFAPLTAVLKWKRSLGRDKDLADIKLIEDYLEGI